MTSTLRAGTRGSDLARWQTAFVARTLTAAHPGLAVEPIVTTTRGDVDLSDRLVGKLDKGFFTRELEEDLLAGRTHFVVHSLKDLPTVMPVGLVLGAVLPRGPVEDLLLARHDAQGPGPLGLRDGARVGSSALRREALLHHYAPQVRPLPLRGNVPTRVQKLRDGAYDAIVLAAAGVTRLGLDLSTLRVQPLDPSRWVPAPGQGAVAVQCRADDPRVRDLLATIDCAATRAAVTVERALLRATEGGCNSPFGALAVDGTVTWGMARATPGGTRWVRSRAPLEVVRTDSPSELAALLDHPDLRLGDADDDLPLR